jgi:PAS domain S-box-containing protein
MSKTILVVEDEGILALLLQNLLSHLGYTVAGPLTTGEETIAYLADRQVDLILMDIDLAGSLNGIDTARKLQDTSDIPVIFLTGNSRAPLIERAKSACPYGYLIKPVGERELAAVLEMALHRHSLDRRLRDSRSALEDSEARIRKKLQTRVEPAGDVDTLQLGEIIDSAALQTMMEQFHRLTGIGIGILDKKGEVLVGVGWQDICTKFHRCHPDTLKNCRESDVLLSAGIPAGTVKAYRCKNNLWDLMTPIEIGGRHVGNVCLGQFFYDDELPDYDFFRNQAREYGFDETEYLAALDLVPRWSRATVAATMDFYASLAKMISTLSYTTVNLSRALSQKDAALSQLDESRKFMEATTMMIPDVVYQFDVQEQRYIYYNRQPAHLLGYAGDEIHSETPVFDLGAVHPKDLALAKKHMDLMACTEVDDQHEVEFRIKGKNNSYIWLYVRERVYRRDGVQRPKILFGIVQDISDRKKAEEENEQLQGQLIQAQKMEAIGTLAGGIAHDFNNILGAILGYAEMVREDCPAGSIAARDLDQILLASNRAKELVKQILAFSRQVDMTKIPLQPASIVKETVKLLRSSLPTTIAIEQDIDPATAPVFADPTQLHQILMNICTNAFHAMEEKGGTLRISLTDIDLADQALAGVPHIHPGRFVRLSISDTGQGIPPEIRERIFEPYFTTKEKGKGTGMGLAIAHGIVKSHGGFITVESQPGKGTVFHITLPALKEYATIESKASGCVPMGSERILFIDDEPMLAEMAKTMLERLGYTVTIRSDSLDAMAIFAARPESFDLVITDQTMPGITGVDLARRMMQIRPDIPIILCTGYSNLISEEKTRSLGIRGFALKPLAKKEIAVLIRNVLDSPKPKGR